MTNCACSSNASDDEDGGELTLTDCGRLPKPISDDLDFTQLIVRTWVSLGIIAPLVVACITLVNITLPGEDIPLFGVVWLAPVCAIAITLVYGSLLLYRQHPLDKFRQAPADVRSELDDAVQMETIAILCGGVVCVVGFAMLDVMILNPLADVWAFDVESTPIQTVRAVFRGTVIIQLIATAAFASHVRTGGLGRAPLYATGLFSVAFVVSLVVELL